MSTVTAQSRPPAPPDLTSPHSIDARRRIAFMRAAGLSAGTVAVLFGFREDDQNFLKLTSPPRGKLWLPK